MPGKLVVKILVGLLAFGLGLSGGVTFFWQNIKQIAAVLGREPLGRFDNPHHVPLFYRTIGHHYPPAAEGDRPLPPRMRYTLEVDQLYDQAKAISRVKELRGEELDAFYSPYQGSDGRVVYKVRIGLYDTSRESESIRLSLKDSHQIVSRVVEVH